MVRDTIFFLKLAYSTELTKETFLSHLDSLNRVKLKLLKDVPQNLHLKSTL